MADKFDDLMAGMGVKPIGKARIQTQKNPASGKKTVVRKKSAVSTGAAPSTKDQPDNAGADPARQERITALEAALAQAKNEREVAERTVTSLQAQVAELEASVAASDAARAASKRSVADELAAWGLETPPERAAFLQAGGWLERVLAEPNLAENTALREEFFEKIVWVCSDCTSPAGRTPVPVGPKRCEVCGGVDLKRAVRRFIDATLVNGRLRVVVVGRDARHQRMLRERVSDPRLVLTQVPGPVCRDVGQAQTDVDHADVVIIWDGDSLPGELRAVYEGATIGGVVPSGAVGPFLEAAAVIIADD